MINKEKLNKLKRYANFGAEKAGMGGGKKDQIMVKDKQNYEFYVQSNSKDITGHLTSKKVYLVDNISSSKKYSNSSRCTVLLYNPLLPMLA